MKYKITIVWGEGGRHLENITPIADALNKFRNDIESGNFSGETLEELKDDHDNKMDQLVELVEQYNNSGAELKTYSFNTKKELNAFVYGVNECASWLNCFYIEEEPARLIKDIINNITNRIARGEI